MKKNIALLIILSLIAGITLAQTQVSNVKVKFKKNGVWHNNTYAPYASVSINPDQGSAVDITITRTETANLPAEFFMSDFNNGSYMSESSNAISHTFYNCVGPLDTQVWATVNVNLGLVEILVYWANPPMPDLVVSNLRVDGSTNSSGKVFHVGEEIDITCAVYNLGGATAGANRLGFYLKNSSNNTSGSPFVWNNVNALTAGSNWFQETSYTFTSSDVGTKYFVVKADYLAQVNEANENNNIRNFGPFQVVAPPNLALTPSSYNFGSVTVNECSNEFSLLLTNNGGSAVTGYVSLINSTNFNITSGGGAYNLSPGQTKTINVEFCPAAAGNISTALKVSVDGLSTSVAHAALSGIGITPPEYIIGESPEFLFDTRLVNSGGIYLNIIETATTDNVKKAGYKYEYYIGNNITGAQKIEKIAVFDVNENNTVYLTPPDIPEEAISKNDFLDQILLFDVNNNQIGHINFSYSFEWESMHSRHVVLFLHNDVEVIQNPEGPPHYFPYSLNSPNNPVNLLGNKVRYNYYQDGEYPVSMLIPPHFLADESNPQGYRFPYEHNSKPVLFVHGLTGTFSYQYDNLIPFTETSGDQVSYWYDTERKLNEKMINGQRKYHAWQFYYPNEDDLKHCGLMLKNAINFLDEKYNDPVNIVSHSMGGPVTMEYLTIPGNYNTQKIGKVMLSMPPIHGSLAAKRNYNTALGFFAQYFGQDGKAPAYKDLSVGSDFFYDLHNRSWSTDLIANTFTTLGLTTWNYRFINYNFKSIFHNEADNHADGVVSYSSASLLDKGIGLLGYYGNHDDGKYSKSLEDKDFFPNLLDKYFEDNSTGNQEFKDYCLNQETVDVLIDGNKNVLKPSVPNVTIDNMSIDKLDVDFQKGILTIGSSTLDNLSFDLWYQPSDNTYRLGSNLFLLPPAEQVGLISKNSYSGNSAYSSNFNYLFTALNGSDLGFIFKGSEQNECINVLLNGVYGWPDYLGVLCRKNMEHQFVQFDLPETKNMAADQKTPTKILITENSSGVKQSILHIDDQASLGEFYFYCEEAYYDNTYYSFSLQTPGGSIIDSTTANVIYYEYPYTSVKKITIQNPEPGEWTVTPITDPASYDAFEFTTKAHLDSEIKAQSLIPQYNHTANAPIQLSGLLELPVNELLSMGSLNVSIIVNSGFMIPDTLFLNNFVSVDTGFIFSNSIIVDSIGVYSYTMIIEGIYNNFRFERAVYGQFSVDYSQPQLIIPDVDMNFSNRFAEIDIPDYFSCQTCDPDSVVFEVGIINSTFDDGDLYYSYDFQNSILSLAIPFNPPSGEASFIVDGIISGSIVASDTIKLIYTALGAPSNLYVTGITDSVAELNWSPAGNEAYWDVAFGYQGLDPESADSLIIGISQNKILLSNLLPKTHYDFYVRAVYETNITSPWTGPGSFTTLDDLSIEDITGDDAFKLLIYPNPSQGNFLVSIYLAKNAQIEFSLLDFTGRQVYKKSEVSFIKGQHDIVFSQQEKLMPGIYILQVYIRDANISSRVFSKQAKVIIFK